LNAEVQIHPIQVGHIFTVLGATLSIVIVIGFFSVSYSFGVIECLCYYYICGIFLGWLWNTACLQFWDGDLLDLAFKFSGIILLL